MGLILRHTKKDQDEVDPAISAYKIIIGYGLKVICDLFPFVPPVHGGL
jgi:hypothetical protein